MLNVTDAIFGDVLLAVPGAPDITVERAIARATRQFCTDTHIWRHTSESLPVIKGLREVELDTPSNSTILRPYWVTLDGRQLLGVSASRISTDEGKPSGYALSPSGVLLLDCFPNESYITNGIQAHFSVAPERGSVEVPDELEPYLDAIQSLAESILLSMPNVDWRDRQGAADSMALYGNYVTQAKRQGNQYNQSIHRTVKYGGV